MGDYEKGVPAWDIGVILTRHSSIAHGSKTNCDRVRSLLNSKQRNARERLAMALATACTCGAGDSSAESTTLKKERDGATDKATAGD